MTMFWMTMFEMMKSGMTNQYDLDSLEEDGICCSIWDDNILYDNVCNDNMG